MKVKLKNDSREKYKSWLRVEDHYDVLEVTFRKNESSDYRIFSQLEQSPILCEVDDFEVIESRIPSNWRIFSDECNGLFTLTPPAWNEMGFWVKYFDGEQEAEEIFDREFTIIINEGKIT